MGIPPRHRSVHRWGVADLDSEGRRICRWCRGVLPAKGGRRTFCSDACVHEWRVRSDAGYARRCVEERDHGVCAGCGVDTHWMREAVQSLRLNRMEYRRYEQVGEDVFGRRKFSYGVINPVLQDIIRRLERAARWEADHIRPVAEGGGDCGLDNLRTLCAACHARETAALRRRLNERNRPIPETLFGPIG